MSRRSVFIGIALSVFAEIPATAQQAADFFRQNCMSCHTIGGGRLTGPDLKNVSERQSREWLAAFVVNPKAVIDSGDAYAREIFEDSRRVMMPAVAGINPERAEALLDLIEAESALEESQYKGLQISDRPFTSEDVALGRELFLGNKPLANGGSACLACHTTRGLGGLSGGRLGPDLTRVYGRLGGRKTMAAWLFAPATPTMGPLFDEHPFEQDEILGMLAFFEDAAQSGGEDDTVALLNFFLLSLGGLIVLLVLFDAIWKGRFRSVRARLVEGKEAEANS